MLNEATSSRINAQCATIQMVRLFEVVRYINIGKLRIIQQTREARSARQLENATALGSRIPPHAVLLQVINENTPVKLKIIFAI